MAALRNFFCWWLPVIGLLAALTFAALVGSLGSGLDSGDVELFLSWGVCGGLLISTLMQLLFRWLAPTVPQSGALRLFRPRNIISLWLPGYFAALGAWNILRAGYSLMTGSTRFDDYLMVGISFLGAGVLASVGLQALFSAFGTEEYFPHCVGEIGARKILTLWFPTAMLCAGAVILVFMLWREPSLLMLLGGAVLTLGPGLFAFLLLRSLYGTFAPEDSSTRVRSIAGLVISTVLVMLFFMMCHFLNKFSMV